MKLDLEKLINHYYSTTTKLSEIIRNLNYTGIAILWFLKTGAANGVIPFEKHLYFPFLGFIISLFLDVMQYLVNAVLINALHWKKEKELLSISDNDFDKLKKEEKEFMAPEYIRNTTDTFFYIKISISILSFIVVIYHFCINLFKN